jgi:hypothetical protein
VVESEIPDLPVQLLPETSFSSEDRSIPVFNSGEREEFNSLENEAFNLELSNEALGPSEMEVVDSEPPADDYLNRPLSAEPAITDAPPEYYQEEESSAEVEPDWQGLPPSTLDSETARPQKTLPPREQKVWDDSFLFGPERTKVLPAKEGDSHLSRRTQTLLENIQIQKDNLSAESPSALKQLQFLFNTLAANAPEGKLPLGAQLKLYEISLSLLAQYGERLLLEGLIACIARPELDPNGAVPYLRGCVKNAYVDQTIRPGEKRPGRSKSSLSEPTPIIKGSKSVTRFDDF